MTYNISFNAEELILVFNALQTSTISGKDAPILAAIFTKMQEEARRENQTEEENQRNSSEFSQQPQYFQQNFEPEESVDVKSDFEPVSGSFEPSGKTVDPVVEK